MSHKPFWTSDRIGRALGSSFPTSLFASDRISIDSRLLKSGDIFLALRGNRVDGHAFVAQAHSKGAAALIVDKKISGLDDAIPQFVVDDCFAALKRLGVYRRSTFKKPVVAITGSVGKTSQKEMIKLALSAYGKVYATPGNYNNQIGLPLTLANLDDDADWLVLELGMSASGEIADLSNMARPDFAVITRIAQAHMMNFNSMREIAEAKLEILDGMDGGSVIALRDQSEYWDMCCERASKRAQKSQVVGYGKSEHADVRFDDVACNLDGTSLRVHFGATSNATSQQYSTRAVGDTVGELLSATLGLIRAAGLAPVDAPEGAFEDVKERLRGFDFPKGRGKMERVAIKNSGHIHIFDHSYNASPASMGAMFKTLRLLRDLVPGKVIAILADMNELGQASRELHRSLLQQLSLSKVGYLLVMGEEMERVRSLFNGPSAGFKRVDDLIKKVGEIIAPGDLVAIKGSNSFGLGAVASSLRA